MVGVGLLVVMLLPAATPSAGGPEAPFPAGSMRIGGQITATVEHVAPGIRGIRAVRATRYSAVLAPEMGYFILDDLELRAGLGAKAAVVPHSDAPVSLWTDIGVRYYLALSAVVIPYGGLTIGPGWVLDTPKATSLTLAIAVPFGLLVPLSRQLAIDLGARVNYAAVVLHGRGEWMSVTVGYLGVQAFFQ